MALRLPQREADVPGLHHREAPGARARGALRAGSPAAGRVLGLRDFGGSGFQAGLGFRALDFFGFQVFRVLVLGFH